MKISFLVTYYNQAEFVPKSLDSILAIDLPEEWEILVGDDGSTDGTQDRVREYMDRYPGRIQLYEMPREPGKKYQSVMRASENRLNLLGHATGDCCCFLDGDDYYLDRSFVREAIRVLENQTNVTAVAFGFAFSENGKLTEEFLLPAESGFIDQSAYIRGMYTHAGAAVFRNTWDGPRLESLRKLRFFDDNNIMMSSLACGEMYYINRIVYAYRQVTGSVYTSMNFLEKATLNVQGFDVDRQLIGKDLENALIRRMANPLLSMYLWRNALPKYLKGGKLEQYRDGSKHLEGSVAYRLLIWPELPKKERAEVRKIIHRAARIHPEQACRQGIKHLLKGNKA